MISLATCSTQPSFNQASDEDRRVRQHSIASGHELPHRDIETGHTREALLSGRLAHRDLAEEAVIRIDHAAPRDGSWVQIKPNKALALLGWSDTA